MELLFESLGWIGAFGLLFAFYLNSSGKMQSTSKAYQWINFVSAFILAINAYSVDSYPFIVINVFWSCVALYGLLSHSKDPVS